MSGSVPSWARVGAKVVCIDDVPVGCVLDCYFDPLPVKGETYIIAGFPDLRLASDTRPGVLIAGLPNRDDQHRDDYGWFVGRFRPLVTDSEALGIEAQFYRAKARKSKAPARESEPVQ